MAEKKKKKVKKVQVSAQVMPSTFAVLESRAERNKRSTSETVAMALAEVTGTKYEK